MIYRLARIIVKISLWISFRKIDLKGLSNIPENTPIIFTSNHPMGFLEPLVITTQIPRIFYYLARGDFFQNKTARWWLGQINIYPIYRFRDGFNHMRNNQNAINNAVEVLKQGKSFMVFAEGSTKLQRSFRPIQKGVARLIHEMLSDDPELQVAIVPIGFNSSDMLSLNTTIEVDVGEAIYANTLFQRQESKPKFLKALTKVIQDKSEELVPQLHDTADESLLDLGIENTHFKDSLDLYKSIANRINQKSPEEKDALRQALSYIQKQRQEKKISRYSLKTNLSVLDIGLCILGLIPFLISYLVHFIPLSMSKWYADRTIQNKAFYAIIRYVSSLVLMCIWYSLLIPISLYLFGVYGLLVIIALILLGRYNHHYTNLFHRVKDNLLHKSELIRLRSLDPFT